MVMMMLMAMLMSMARISVFGPVPEKHQYRGYGQEYQVEYETVIHLEMVTFRCRL
ncbi:hypothetical protein HORIV_17130 [Vreelandella olivaria]|uniref:Uncharacterized protein n=1 Tax=Vreelandella olivaria TaxID=390919 RepID=A0ABM7GFC8_9GAMM|nr:hypothetical protein HORIV_17130 [Halomonas olivaria]